MCRPVKGNGVILFSLESFDKPIGISGAELGTTQNTDLNQTWSLDIIVPFKFTNR